MKLLKSVLPFTARLQPATSLFTLLVLGSLVAIEVVGHSITSDMNDGVSALGLVLLGCGIVIRHRRDPIPWASAFAACIRRWLHAIAWLRYEHGLDLRGTPAFPRRIPPLVWAVFGLLVIWGIVAGLLWLIFPTGWRTIGTQTIYIAYLGCLISLWAALIGCTFAGVFVLVAVIDRTLKGWVGETDRRGAELAVVVGYVVLVSAIAWAVPPTTVLVLCLLGFGVATLVALLKGRSGAAILWRSGPGNAVYAIPIHRVVAITAAIATLLLFDLLLTACGGRLLGVSPDESMPLTAVFGAMAAWSVPGLFVVSISRLWTAVRSDPSRNTPPTVSVDCPDATQRSSVTRIFRSWGWRTSSADLATDATTIGVKLVKQDKSAATEFDPPWPLAVSESDLLVGDVRQRLDRRDEIQLRRRFFRGLSKLFKRASVYKGPGGGGFWVAPHWWFIEGVARDDADGGEEVAPPLVGPPYQRVIPARARQHIHRVLRATQVDMIFVEDGVGAKKLEKVFRVLLELYDVHAGRRRAEELHFLGMPKVRVMIHNYEPENPFRSDVYPEPKFDDLSRIRVLHIFRDREGHEELVEPPYDFSWTPAPVGMMR